MDFKMNVHCLTATTALVLLHISSLCCAAESTESRWRQPVRKCLDTLLEKGTDRYGSVHSPLLMAVLDVHTHQSPEQPLVLDSLVRLEDRLHRRAERGSNLWYDQALLRSLHRMAKLTGDAKYAAAADAYIQHFFQHCYKPADGRDVYRNGMPTWGTHIYWDCYLDRPGGDQDGVGPHEILVYLADWESMHRVSPEAVRRTIDGIWNWHIVDKTTGVHNRHDDARLGCDFAFSGGSFAHAFAFMYHATGEENYLEKAKLVANWHWKHRHPETNLVPDAPCNANRYDGNHCFTTVTGPHSAQLLRCYELTGEKLFRELPTTYIKAYDKYGWDEKAGTYHAMLQLDGTPVGEKAKGKGYDAWAPYGHIDVWRTSIYSYEFALCAAQAAVYAYELSGDSASERDPQLLAISRRWAKILQDNLPPESGRRWKAELEQAMPAAQSRGGVYAEDYGRAISFFVHMFRATSDEQYRQLAESLADEAVAKLFENGLFKGHAAKPYYETTNGVGLLLLALLELDAPEENLGGAL